MIFLAIDNMSLPVTKNLCLHLSKPAVRREPVLLPSALDSNAPDNQAAHFYGTVLFDQGRFRMWYYACHQGANPDWSPPMARQLAKYKASLIQGPFCYAESDDGIHWSKPPLGQVLFKGSRNNNAIALPHAVIAGATLLKDEDDPNPDRRYKMVYEIFPEHSDPPFEEWGKVQTIVTAISPDGLRWTQLSMPYLNGFMEQSSFYRHAGKYIVGYQTCSHNSWFSEGGAPCGRTGAARFSLDFDHWIDGEVESFALTEPRDASQRGCGTRTDQVHLGVAAASFGNVCVGLYGLWHDAPEFMDISCDLGLLVSNDGLHFREPVKGHVYIGSEESPVTPCAARKYHTNLCQANGILNVGNETRIYHGRWRNTGSAHLEDYHGEVALATLPRDRWGALGLFPTAGEGSVWTEPLKWTDHTEITLNAVEAGCIRVEIADEQFGLMPDFSSLNAAVSTQEGGLDCPVRWKTNDPSRLNGRSVRLRLSLKRNGDREPRLYALNVRSRTLR